MSELEHALEMWDAHRGRHGEGKPRLLITADSAGFHLRLVRVVQFARDVECESTRSGTRTVERESVIYHCDTPLGSTTDLSKLPDLILDALNEIRREASHV
ncbi:hypothetical protein BH09PLA1_BH09PLA1_26050 [soil metagenome]